jgi:hypothetical protein
MKRPLIEGKDFHKLPLNKENKLKVMGSLCFLGEFCLVVWGKQKILRRKG